MTLGMLMDFMRSALPGGPRICIWEKLGEVLILHHRQASRCLSRWYPREVMPAGVRVTFRRVSHKQLKSLCRGHQVHCVSINDTVNLQELEAGVMWRG